MIPQGFIFQSNFLQKYEKTFLFPKQGFGTDIVILLTLHYKI